MPVRKKLTLLLMAAGVSAVFLMGSTAILFSYIKSRNDLVRDLTGIADMIGQNSQVALTFNIPEDAAHILASLQHRQTLRGARLFDAKGAVFASYGSVEPSAGPEMGDADMQYDFSTDHLHFSKKIRFNDNVIGTICLCDSMESIRENLVRDSLVLIVIVIGTLFFIRLIAGWLQGFISRPILSLATVAQAVSEHKDYAVRAEKEADDEIGLLIDSFNGMLGQIRQRENALQESEERYRLLFQKSIVGILQFDAQLHVVDFNERLLSIMRTTRDLAIGLDMNTLVDQSMLPPVRRALAGREGFYEGPYRTTTSSADIWIAMRTAPLLDDGGRVLGGIAIIEDITDRKAAMEERTRLISAIEQASEAVSILSVDGTVLYLNPAAENILGWPLEKIKGRNPFLHKSEATGERLYSEALTQLIAGRPWAGRVTHPQKNGTRLHIELTIAPVRDLSGTITSYVSIGRDMTKELKMEEQLRQSQKMEAIGTLAGGIAHDFNNILSAIMGYAELAQDEAPAGSKMKPSLEQVLLAAERARNLVKQILVFSRKDEQEAKPVQLHLVIREAIKFLRASLPTTIAIQDDITRYNDTILADATQIHQIVINLCTNAAHAMEKSGGTLEVTLFALTLDNDDVAAYTGLLPGPHVKLMVRDTGTGIAPEILDRIFEPFFTTKEAGKGTGMGLAVVHGIVKRYGGDIKVYSEVGKGTAFSILLPRIPDGTLDRADEDAMPPPRGTERILLVDDQASVLDTVRQMLESLGYTVTAAGSSTMALELFKQHPERFDLVISDQTMPHMTGHELAIELLHIKPDLPLILCTGYSEKVSEETAKKTGIKAFILKPVRRRELAKLIRRVIAGNA